MAKQTVNLPDIKNRPPNTGDSAEMGDTFYNAMNKINGMMTDLYGAIPTSKYNTNTGTSGLTLTGANITGGSDEVTLNMTGTLGGAANAQLPAVTDLVAAMTAAGLSPQIGQAYILYIYNTSSANFAWTVTTNTGWTLNNTMSIAQNTYRKFYVTLTSLSAAVIQSLGTFSIGGGI